MNTANSASDIPAITVDADVQGGAPCFAGTRVPVASLFAALKHGRSIDYFLEQFPTVRHSQVCDVLDQAMQFITRDERR